MLVKTNWAVHMRLRFLAIMIAAFALANFHASAQTASPTAGELGPANAAPPQSGTDNDEIVVTAPTQSEMIRSFINQIVASPSTIDKLAQWDQSICVRVAGFPRRYGQYIVDRISQRAFQVGLTSGGPHCRPRMFVFLTSDPQGFALAAARQRRIMRYYDVSEDVRENRGQTAEDFVLSSRPVRWWHVGLTVNFAGYRLGAEGESRPSGMYAANRLRGSLRGRATRQDFLRALIVVDANRISGVRLESLADYIAMVGLAQLDPTADTTGIPTILNLFSPQPDSRTEHPTLTDWDVAYLHGLYSNYANRFQRLPSRQQQIAHQMDATLNPVQQH